MSEELFRRQTVVAGKHGEVLLAHIAECPACRGTEFLLLVVHDQAGEEYRVQCKNCGTSYGVPEE